ncbi:MAG: TonB-dependent receptor [Bacteroidales bacterium]|nr:TonB-dependent receptor [Bacteroidales bacterium]
MKKPKIQSAFALFLLICLSLQLSAQSAVNNYAALRGVVTEKGSHSQAVEFATVQILPQGALTTTNSNGEFSFERLSPGKVNVRIQFLGMEAIDTTLILVAGKASQEHFYMNYSSFRLNEVSVVAQESKAGQATASNISRQAMDHLQVTSVSDLLQLMPGGQIANPDLSVAKSFNIRNISGSVGKEGTAGTEMNSLGTAIYIDGSPLSNNANLQTLSPSISGGGASVSGGSSPNSGLDLRMLSTDNIESVEVIRGIPSVEYGDLTSGAVIIRSKAGKEPLNIRFKTDPRIYQMSAGKGFSLGEKAGNLNVSGDYAYSVSQPTESYKYYQRATAKVLYSNVFKNLSSNTSLDFSLGKDTREKNPDDMRNQLASGSQDMGIRLNTNGTINVNKGWLNNIKYTLSGNYTDKHSYKEELLGNAFSAYSMSRTDGASLSNRPGQKVYDINGTELTNIPDSEGSYYATYLPNEYFSKYDIYGKEINLFAKVNATFSKRIGNISNRIVVGADYKIDGNVGDGKVYDLANPPFRSGDANSSPRPRKYSDIPFVSQLGVYLEENFNWQIGQRELTFQAGARYDNIESKSIVSPRVNISFDIIPSKLTIRGGYGINAKAPTLLYLYPENAYFDFVHFNNLNSSSVPAAEQLLLGSTKVYNTENKDLRIASNEKSEIGLDFKWNKMRFSATAFNENLKNGYDMTSQFKLVNYKEYEIGTANPGSIPTLKEKSSNNIFISYSTPTNTGRSHNRGVEFDFDLGRFDAIRTSFVLNGAYIRSTNWDETYTYSTQKNLNQLERNIGVYAAGNTKEERERLSTTLRATHNIPSIGFAITLTAQVNLLYKEWDNIGNDSMFVSYISRTDGLMHAFDPAMKNDPEFSYLFKSNDPRRFIGESWFPTVVFNLHLTKEIGKMLRASFFANNMFQSKPLYEKKRTPGSFVVINDKTPLFFGFELAVTIK